MPEPKKRKASIAVLGWILLLATGSIIWVLQLRSGDDPARVWRALLINFLYFTPLAAGLVTWSAIVIAANARWPGQAERMAWSGIGFFAPCFIILFLLWVGSPNWAPWYGKELHQGVWLDNNVLFLRVLTGLLVFWAAAAWFLFSRLKGRSGAILPAAILVIVFAFVFTLFSFDLVVALSPEWRSALFGGYFFISSLYLAAVFWAFMAVLHGFGPELRHDLGKLVLAFSILTTSLLFMQLLTIWYENIPEETSYLIRRMHYPDWAIVSSALLVVVYFGPLLLLVTEWSKKNRVYLGIVTGLLLVGLWVERWWMVAPTFSRHATFGLAEAAATAAFAGALALSIETIGRFLPELPGDEVIRE